MTDLLQDLDALSLLVGGLAGLALALLAGWVAWRQGAAGEAERAAPRFERLETDLRERDAALAEAGEKLIAVREELAVTRTRLEQQADHFQRERAGLEQAEKRLTESFERLAGKVFDERSRRFTELSEKQLDGLLKPLVKDLESFRKRVDETHGEELKQHAALRERLEQLENLNQQLNEEARNLSRALTTDVKTQGSWGEQQLEKLLELGGLRKGESFHTQVSVTGKGGERLQPDLVLSLPEGRSIVMDSKVSLTAWTRAQATEDEGEREGHLGEHVRSLKAHIDGLAAKDYAGAEELNALDFVLMFVPIEAALIEALRYEPSLPEYALRKRVALLSPANFLATVRTVASVWMVHRQNANARDIAERAGLLYDKFVGFVGNLDDLGSRLDQARRAYDSAFSQLSTGAGNLVGQVEKLRKLGARHAKQLDDSLAERALEEFGEEADEQSSEQAGEQATDEAADRGAEATTPKSPKDAGANGDGGHSTLKLVKGEEPEGDEEAAARKR